MFLHYGKTSCAVFRHCRVVFFFSLVARAICAAHQNQVSSDTLWPAGSCVLMLPGIGGTLVGFGSGFRKQLFLNDYCCVILLPRQRLYPGTIKVSCYEDFKRHNRQYKVSNSMVVRVP